MRTLFTFFFLIFISLFANAQCWNLVWEDEFDGNTLDLNKWEYQIGGNGWGNNELQYYTNQNAEVSDGTLKIIADQDVNNTHPSNDYVSSRIRTINKGDWRYGKMEASIKLPIGQGIWPAFWMMPTESVYGIWPRSGEIDIMEYLGHQPSTVHGTCHYGWAWNDKGSSGTSTSLASGTFPEDFHTFSIEWEPTQIRWYLDGVQYHETNSNDPDFSFFLWPFDEKFHFILNVAVGGNWPGPPNSSTVFPQQMEVDWVRAYQQFPDLEMEGDLLVTPQSNGTVYSIPSIPNTYYYWTVPSGASIAEGQGTNEISVDWGDTGGEVVVEVYNSCGNYSISKAVTVTPNLWLNWNFEEEFANWSTNTHNGSAANFTVTDEEVYEGSLSACVEVYELADNPWDIQLGRTNISLEQGVDYTLSFWAKGSIGIQDVNIAFVNQSTFELIYTEASTISEDWQQYFFSFTAPDSETALFNLDLGDEVGISCFDDFLFTQTALVNTHERQDKVAPLVYPNPSNHDLFVEGNALEKIELFDVNGRLLKREKIVSKGRKERIDLSGIPNGIYLIKVVDQGRAVIQKLIIQ